MKRTPIRVEPISTYLESYRRRSSRSGPIHPVVIAGELVYVSGLPPFDTESGEIKPAPIELQTELCLDQMKRCLEAAGATFDNVMKCNIYCTSARHFAAVNAVYRRYFPQDPPARVFVNVVAWPGRFDIEIDCVALCKRS